MEVPRLGGFEYVLRQREPFKWTLLRDQQFLPLLQPLLVFTARSYEALSSGIGTLGCAIWPGAEIAPSPSVPPDFYPPHMNVGPPILSATATI